MTGRHTPTLCGTSTAHFLSVLRASGLLDGGSGAVATAPASPADQPPPGEDPTLLLGRSQLGHYRLLEPLGSGGMGQVYLAEHRIMRRRVALKVLAPALVNDAAAVARFQREVLAAARLAHPHIVTAYDAAEADGLHFLVMEHVTGVDLGRVVAEMGPLPVRFACQCAYQAALGLQHAHERGLVHCDVKPSNLLLTDAHGLPPVGHIKILDFGLARLAGARPQTATVTGEAVSLSGTPDFMAPEQAHDGRAADARSDLYGLGCTLYYLLSGRLPFPGGTWSEKLLRHQFDQPEPVDRHRPDVPPEIVALVRRLMAKDPEERYPSAAAVVEVLDVWLGCDSPPTGWAPGTPADLVGTTPPNAAALTPRPPARVDAVTFSSGELELPPEGAAVPIRPGPRRYLSAVVLTAVTAGLGTAWFAREQSWRLLVERPPAARAESAPARPPFEVASARRDCRTLAEAVAAAADGDTVTVHANGPFLVTPISLGGKSLTVRAAPGYRPCLEWVSTSDRPSWQPLLAADRPLTLVGLEFRLADEAPAGDATHFVYAAEALHLEGCRFDVGRGTALVVCRTAREVVVRDCSFVARSAPLTIEAAAGPVRVDVANTSVEVGAWDGAALTVWARPGRPADPLRIGLRHNRVTAGRLLALAGPAQNPELDAEGNQLRLRQLLVSLGDGGDWRKAVRWQGRHNRFDESAGVREPDGRPADPVPPGRPE
jgi:serine/threonine protein kinase